METEISTTEQFQIKQDSFEGPIEVLLELIEKRKLFVNDISLASVTDDFISYIQNKGTHPDQMANFLSIAATLILIKARSLLPNIELTKEENESIDELERRLSLYKIVNNLALKLQAQYKIRKSYLAIKRKSIPIFSPSTKMRINDLLDYLENVLKLIPPKINKVVQTTVMKVISISEVIATLTSRLEKAMKTSFNSIIVNSPDKSDKAQKVYTIVSFLGMLELVRCGFVNAEQRELFSDIELDKNNKEELCEVNTESYE